MLHNLALEGFASAKIQFPKFQICLSQSNCFFQEVRYQSNHAKRHKLRALKTCLLDFNDIDRSAEHKSNGNVPQKAPTLLVFTVS